MPFAAELKTVLDHGMHQPCKDQQRENILPTACKPEKAEQVVPTSLQTFSK